MKNYLLLTLALCTVGFVGCGGGSSKVVTSPYKGSYAGTFKATPTTGVQVGTFTTMVGSDGKLTGSTNNTTANVISSLAGTVSNSGQVSVTIVNTFGTDTATGTVAFAANGHLIGSLTQFHSTTLVGPLTFDVTQQ